MIVGHACAGEHRLYIDGALVASGAYAGSLADGGAVGLGVGVKPTDDGLGVTGSAQIAGYWAGSINEVA